MLGRCCTLEPFSEFRLFIIVVWRIPFNIRRIAFEEIRDEDLVGVFGVAECKDIGTLYGLREEAEDIVDEENSSRCGFRASDIYRISISFTS